ncbi:MAG: hypothetical protein IPM64_08015 [Phycisphaerales bacterium]|nr:hypothetical protein [Phycisphaerales bacterium]
MPPSRPARQERSISPGALPDAAIQTSTPPQQRLVAALALLPAIASIALVWLTRWISQDAFISLRYVENFWAGDGLVFNVGQRVQGFTHPLWMLLLLAAPPEWSVVHAINLGLICTTGAIVAAWWLLAASERPLLGMSAFCLLFFSSRSALEWSTSGLENSLNHAIIAISTAMALRSGTLPRRQLCFALAFGALLLNRVDQLFLALPLVGLAAWRALRSNPRGLRSTVAFCRAMLLGILPLIVWLAFAAFYYGFPLPNTSYAKLGGATRADALLAGLLYLRDFARYEPFHAGVIAFALFFPWIARLDPARRAAAVCVALGILLQLGYVLSIGGDYMRGRFLTSSLFSAALLIGFVLAAARSRVPVAAAGRPESDPAGAAPAGHQSAMSGAASRPRAALWRRIAPIVAACGVLLLLAASWRVTLRERPFDARSGVSRIWLEYNPFPEIRADGRALTRSAMNAGYRNLSPFVRFNERFATDRRPDEMFSVRYTNLGDDTFGMGPRLRVVDLHGLADPFVARCRPSLKNRTGHVQRAVPLAYLHARRVVNLGDDWLNRVVALDANLAAELDRRAAEAPWPAGPARQVFEELEVLTAAPLSDARRWPLIWKYTVSRPQAWDPGADAVTMPVSDIPAGAITIHAELAPVLVLRGVEPSQFDYCDPRLSGRFWLGNGDAGEVAIELDAREPVRAVVRVTIEALGPAVDPGAGCRLEVRASDGPMGWAQVRAAGEVSLAAEIPAGVSRLRLHIPGAPSGGRYYRDPRPLMVLIGGVHVEPSGH